MKHLIATILVAFTTLTATPAQAATVDVTIATLNTNGGYTTEGGTWKKRLPYVVKTMLASGASVHLIQEAHESAGEHKQILAEINRQSSASWALAVGRGGNHFIYKNRKHTLLSVRTVKLPHSRYYSEALFKNQATGVRFTAWNTHLTATMLPDRPADVADEMRADQARVIATQLERHTKSVGGGDINDGFNLNVRPILAEAGTDDVRTRTTNVTNAEWDSHELHYGPNKMRGRWIDYLGASQATTVHAAGLLDSVNASDHNLLWTKVTF